jgi:branched-chain amino acid transport system permease protein
MSAGMTGRLQAGRAAVPLLLLAIVFVVVPGVLALIGAGYYIRLAQLTLITIILTTSLNLLVGTAGLLSIAMVAFYGIGAYTSAILATRYGSPFLVNIVASGAVAAAIGFLLALPIMRLVSIFFAVATLGIAASFHTIVLNWSGLTRGAMGIPNIPSLSAFGFNLSSPFASYYVIALTCTIAVAVIHRLTHSYYGNAVRAVREDEECARAMGIGATRLKIEVFTVSSFFLGVAGSLLAHTALYISPDMFQLIESILVLTAIVVGGLGSVPGAVAGALILVLVPEAVRGLGDLRALAFGCVLFLSILLLPRGLFGEVSALRLIRKQLGAARGGRRTFGWR